MNPLSFSRLAVAASLIGLLAAAPGCNKEKHARTTATPSASQPTTKRVGRHRHPATATAPTTASTTAPTTAPATRAGTDNPHLHHDEILLPSVDDGFKATAP